jgi:signal transduction histidine kinase
MTVPRPLRTLRITIPVLVVPVALAAVLVCLSFEWSGLQNELAAQTRQHAAADTRRLLEAVDEQAARGSIEGVERLVASRRADPDVEAAALVDHEGRVVAASRQQWIGRPLAEVALLTDPQDREILSATTAEVRRLQREQLFETADGRSMVACFPSADLRREGEPRGARSGVLLVVHSREAEQARASSLLWRLAAVQATAVLAMAAGLGVAFHFLVTRRIRRVLQTFRAFAAGDDSVRIADRIPDEIGDLCAGLDEMMARVARGVNELRDTGRMHRRNEERLRGTLASLDDLVFTIGPDGRFEAFLQPRKADALYVSPDLFVGRPIVEVQFPDDVKQLLADSLEQLRFSDEVLRHEYTLEMPPGRSWYSATISRRLDSHGGFAGITAVVRDISGQRQAEEEQARLQVKLQNAAAEWRRTFDAMETAIVILDEAARVQRLNRAAAEALGQPIDGCVGRGLETLAGSEPWLTARKLATATLRRGGGGSCQIRDPPSGRSWDLSLAPMPARDHTEDDDDAAPKHRSCLLLARDITSLVTLQDSVRKAERVAAMGSLTGSVAHEVRKPLFAISANVDALEAQLRSSASPGVAETLAAVRTELSRMTRLMESLLSFGKPASQTLVDEPLRAALQLAAGSCASMAQRNGVLLQTSVADDATPVRIDRERIAEVIEKLIENAIQHSPRGGTVSIASGTFRENGRAWVRCAVGDDGPGFEENDLVAVFEPFFTRRRGGTGLGLSIARRILEQHGGRICAANKPAGGARMIVELPGVDTPPAAA